MKGLTDLFGLAIHWTMADNGTKPFFGIGIKSGEES